MENTSTTTREDIAAIKNEIKNIAKNLEDLKKETKEFIRKLNLVDNQQAKLEERVSNLNIFQTALSIVIGAIATYLGVNGK